MLKSLGVPWKRRVELPELYLMKLPSGNFTPMEASAFCGSTRFKVMPEEPESPELKGSEFSAPESSDNPEKKPGGRVMDLVTM